MGCSSEVTVGDVTMASTDFENADMLISEVSGDLGDPVQDGYDENIATGNNSTGTTGIQFPAPVQTSAPPAITSAPSAKDTTIPDAKSGVATSHAVWTGDYDLQLSPNFKVRHFTINALYPNQLTDYMGITATVRCNNLKALAVNVAEPILAKFGQLRINSGIRNASSTPSGISQHITGQAMDIQFEGWNYAKYWANAMWIRDNIPYDQFIFEHSSTTGLAWYHLSFNPSGNRPSSASTKVMTMYQNHYNSGLERHG